MGEGVLDKTVFLKYMGSFNKVPEITILSTLCSMYVGACTPSWAALSQIPFYSYQEWNPSCIWMLYILWLSEVKHTYFLRLFANKWSLVLKSQISREVGSDHNKMVYLFPSSLKGWDLPLLFCPHPQPSRQDCIRCPFSFFLHWLLLLAFI